MASVCRTLVPLCALRNGICMRSPISKYRFACCDDSPLYRKSAASSKYLAYALTTTTTIRTQRQDGAAGGGEQRCVVGRVQRDRPTVSIDAAGEMRMRCALLCLCSYLVSCLRLQYPNQTAVWGMFD